jgi:hypothetical protein
MDMRAFMAEHYVLAVKPRRDNVTDDARNGELF